MSDKETKEELVLVKVIRPVRFRHEGKGYRKGDPPFEVPRRVLDKWRRDLAEVPPEPAPEPEADAPPIEVEVDVEALQAAVDAEDHNGLGAALSPLVDTVPKTKAERLEVARGILGSDSEPTPEPEAS